MGKRRSGELTEQQEKFARLIVTGLNLSAAYREAYNVKYMKAKTVNESASRLAGDRKITARVEELRKPVVEKTRYELEQAMKEAENAMNLAIYCGQAAAAVSAIALRSKLNGLLVEERKNDRTALQDLTDEQLNNYEARLDDRAAAVTGKGSDKAGARTTH